MLAATGGRGVDVVLDSVGGTTFADSQAVLAPLGRLVSFGNASSEAQVMPDAEAMRVANRGVLGFDIVGLAHDEPERARRWGRRAFELAAAGRLPLETTAAVP